MNKQLDEIEVHRTTTTFWHLSWAHGTYLPFCEATRFVFTCGTRLKLILYAFYTFLPVLRMRNLCLFDGKCVATSTETI